MSYAGVHARALATVARKGASVTFTRVTQTYTASTDLTVPASSTVTGKAVRDKGNPKTYERLSLVQSEAPTLLFVPDTYGDLPLPDDTVTWGGSDFTVRDSEAIAPDGTTIAAFVVVAR